MKQAKASEKEISCVRDFLADMEANGKPVPIGWRRVVEGYELLVTECCDPDLDYLYFRPEILAAINHYNSKIDAESKLQDAGNDFLDGMETGGAVGSSPDS